MAEIRSFIGGINKDHYVVLAELGDGTTVLCMRRNKKGEPPLVKPLRSMEDYDTVVSVFQSQNFTSDILSAIFAIGQSIERLTSDSASTLYVNRGLFSNYFLKERLKSTLSERKRSIGKEVDSFLTRFQTGKLEADFASVAGILDALEYRTVKSGSDKYALASASETLDAVAIVTAAENLDIMGSDRTVPAMAAVAALRAYMGHPDQWQAVATLFFKKLVSQHQLF
ncbi:MAG: hypothetical protein ABI347_03515 [Nitrososphaera sp.]